jgi:hypothetical protein
MARAAVVGKAPEGAAVAGDGAMAGDGAKEMSARGTSTRGTTPSNRGLVDK